MVEAAQSHCSLAPRAADPREAGAARLLPQGLRQSNRAGFKLSQARLRAPCSTPAGMGMSCCHQGTGPSLPSLPSGPSGYGPPSPITETGQQRGRTRLPMPCWVCSACLEELQYQGAPQSQMCWSYRSPSGLRCCRGCAGSRQSPWELQATPGPAPCMPSLR